MIDVVHVLEAADGGTRTHILQIMRGLDRARFRQTLIASVERNASFRQDLASLHAEGFRVIEVPMTRRIAPVRDVVAFARLLRELKSSPRGIVHTHASKAGALARPAARLADMPRVIHTPHVFYFEGRSGKVRKLFRAVERYLLRYTSRLILLTEAQRRTAVEELGADPSRVSVIPNGVDVELFSPGQDTTSARRNLQIPADGPLIGCITRFMPQKGNDVFLQALGRVFQEVPAARALLVGKGPLRENAMRLAERLGLRDRVRWIPRTDHPERIYGALDVFALASRYEGMPYTLLEAMACAVPVAVSDIPGCADVVRAGTDGLLCRPDDPAALAEAILRLLKDPAEAQRLARQARDRVASDFSLDRFLANLAAVYEQEAGA